ncbi:UNVERIFIED_CONTAM: hypothetical protein RF653_10220 [Kocuria sp. CPCC 205316]|uniref:hypothetical protein n=1 Tax=Kocuria TaxID=57493 RepID=UPI0036DD9D1E
MPLFEPTLPANRVPKPKKQKHKTAAQRKRQKRILVVSAYAVTFAVGAALIHWYLSRAASGNPMQGEVGVIGMGLICFGFLCILLGQDDRGNRRGR